RARARARDARVAAAPPCRAAARASDGDGAALGLVHADRAPRDLASLGRYLARDLDVRRRPRAAAAGEQEQPKTERLPRRVDLHVNLLFIWFSLARRDPRAGPST